MELLLTEKPAPKQLEGVARVVAIAVLGRRATDEQVNKLSERLRREVQWASLWSCMLWWSPDASGRGFSAYYRITRQQGADDDAGQGRKKGVKEGRVEKVSMAFGTLGKIKRRRGLTHEELLWGELWALLMLEETRPTLLQPSHPTPGESDRGAFRHPLRNKKLDESDASDTSD